MCSHFIDAKENLLTLDRTREITLRPLIWDFQEGLPAVLTVFPRPRREDHPGFLLQLHPQTRQRGQQGPGANVEAKVS